ncbi:MAG: chemotaxis protein CheB [Pseudonocardiaceae bacterium]|nr:MAG: chemotaxis protein CheB [Pseudonocardiaceae bacterium]
MNAPERLDAQSSTSVPHAWPRHVVVLACSAGGLQAVEHVLAPLPVDLPAAVVVVQHRRPDDVDLLAPILRRHCRLPVDAVRHGDLLCEGRVAVVPPGMHALATPGATLALIPTDGPPPYRPSADLLLVTLAVAAGPRTIAVILSGGGRDGATGAVAVHAFGGTVLTTDEATSDHFAMPRAAIARHVVDRVLALDDIATELVTRVAALPGRSAEPPAHASI